MKTKPDDPKAHTGGSQRAAEKHWDGSKHSEEVSKAMVLWMTTGCKSSSLTGTNFQYHLEGDCSGSKERNVGIGKEHQQGKLKAVILKCTSAINTFIFQRACSLEIEV